MNVDDRDYLKKVCVPLFLLPDDSGVRIFYEKRTNADVKSLPMIPCLRILSGRVCLKCDIALPHPQQMAEHARTVHGYEIGYGKLYPTLSDTACFSEEEYLMQSIHVVKKKYFVIREQNSTSMAYRSLDRNGNNEEIDLKFAGLQAQLEQFDLRPSKVLGRFICLLCGCTITSVLPDLKRHFREKHKSGNDLNKMIAIAEQVKHLFPASHELRDKYISGSNQHIRILPEIPGLLKRKGQVCPIDNCGKVLGVKAPWRRHVKSHDKNWENYK